MVHSHYILHLLCQYVCLFHWLSGLGVYAASNTHHICKAVIYLLSCMHSGMSGSYSCTHNLSWWEQPLSGMNTCLIWFSKMNTADHLSPILCTVSATTVILFFVLYLLLLVHMTDDLYYTFQDILNLQYITVKYTLHLFNCMISEYKRHAKNVT